MKVVYNLIKSPLILLMIGFLIIELIIYFSLFMTLYYFLEENEEYISKTLISQSDEVFNSINFLINSKLNSVTKDLLLFNQHINIKQEHSLVDYNYDNCEILNSKSTISNTGLNLEDLNRKNRAEKIKDLLINDYLKQIAIYSPAINPEFNIEDYDKNYICYMVSFLKSIFAKNIISDQYLEKLNYTFYVNDLILFYPGKSINDESLKNLPFYNNDKTCKYSTYTFECSSIPNFQYEEEELKEENSIIYMDLKLSLKNLYVNSCINSNLRIFKDNDELNNNDDEKYFCIASNLTRILEEINSFSNYFTFNIIQYNKESDGINLLYSSNNFLYSDISFNKEIFLDLFTSDEYGKYQLKKNSEENIADLFHLLYYEIEKYRISGKTREELIQEYEQNIKRIKEAIKNKEDLKDKPLSITVKQSFVRYETDNTGKIDFRMSFLDEDDFMFILRPIVTDTVKIIKEKNIIDREFKKEIFYTLTVIKLTKPKRGLIYTIYNFICLRIFFYSLTFEGFICIIFYIFLFFLMRCILNPFNIFKASIEKLLDNNIKSKREREKELNAAKNDEDQTKQNKSLENNNPINSQKNNENINNNRDETLIKNSTENDYMNNYIKSTLEIKHQYTNLEMKEIENIVSFLQKILLLRDLNTPYQAKGDFYQSISSEISKKYQLDLFRCQLLIGEYYIKDKQYLKAKKELENFQIWLERCGADAINKDKFIEKKNAFLSTNNDSYINDYSNKDSIKNDKFINLEMITAHFHYLMGLTDYFLFLELKKEKKEISNEYNKQKINGSKNLNDIIAKNFNLNINNNGIDYNSQTNKLIEQMDYHLEKAIKHFKESYKINNSLKINQIKNIIILVYLSRCYIEFSNKSVEDANKVLKKAFLSLYKFNKFIIELTDNSATNITKKNFNNNNNHFLLFKNFGVLLSQIIKKSYIDSRVMLIVNGSLMQVILYQIGKMALKMHKIKTAYFCFVKLIQISFFKNENIHFKAIKWIRFILKNQASKGKKSSTLKLLQFQSKRNNNSYGSLATVEEEETFIKKSSIEYMKSYLQNLIEIFEKNKYKRREKKISKELLSLLEKKINYIMPNRNSSIRKRSRLNSRNNIFSFIQSQGSLTGSNKDLNQLMEQSKFQGENSPTFPNGRNDQRSASPKNDSPDKNLAESISRSEYESITKSFLIKDLLIAQIIHSPLKLRQEEKIIKNIEKQYFRLNFKKKSNKCLIIILSEIFLDNFSSLKSFNLFLQYCIMKFLDDKDKIGYIYYSFSTGSSDKIYELEYKEKALKKLDELFQHSNSSNKNKKTLNQKKFLTDSFDTAMDMFINEQLNNDYDIDTKTDKYIFCFGTLNSLRYKCFEASFSQTNRMNYMEISLYYFVFDSIDNNKNKIKHYKKYFKKFIEGFLIFVENFKLIKLCFTNICTEGKQKNLFSNKLECIKNII